MDNHHFIENLTVPVLVLTAGLVLWAALMGLGALVSEVEQVNSSQLAMVKQMQQRGR